MIKKLWNRINWKKVWVYLGALLHLAFAIYFLWMVYLFIMWFIKFVIMFVLVALGFGS